MEFSSYKEQIIKSLKEYGGNITCLLDEDVAWREIQEALVNAINYHKLAERQIKNDLSGGLRRDFYDELSNLVAETHKRMTRIKDSRYMQAPMGWAVGDIVASDVEDCELDVDWAQVEKDIKSASRFIDALEKWTRLAASEAQNVVIKHRPLNILAMTLDQLAYSLGLIYFRQTGRAPAYSKSENETAFERFMIAVANAMNLHVSSLAVQNAVGRLTRSLEFLLAINEPLPDPEIRAADVFARYLTLRLGD